MIINIGRQFGSGGREIGEQLARALNIAFFDRELLNIAAKESGLRSELFEQADECAKRNFLGLVTELPLAFLGGSAVLPYSGLTNETLFTIQSDVIRNLAESQSCLFVGRCADYILRERTDCLNIFICANEADRIARTSIRSHCTEKQAVELIDKNDRQRAVYYDYYTNKTWGKADSYHVCVNSSLLGISGTVDFLKSIVNQIYPTE